MHWIMEWCRKQCGQKSDCDHCREGYCKPRFYLAEQVKCSEKLLWMLVNARDAVTHPVFADRIADFTGATPEQRDSIVARKHHGTYQRKPPACKTEPNQPKNGCRPVVIVDRAGFEARRVNSLHEAAEKFRCTPFTISNRCKRVELKKNEFEPFGFTFRYADEWDSMTEQQCKEDLQRGNHA